MLKYDVRSYLLKVLMTEKSGGVAADNWTTLIFQDKV